MQILLPDRITQRLVASLKKVDRREIGGILMGEYVSDAVYRVKDITIQHRGGTFTSFVRAIKKILNPLNRFFHDTEYNFTRFNYLGEWHSHPLSVPEPSSRDCEAMWEIVEDPQVGANFAVLMIVHLDGDDQLEGIATVYLPGQQMFQAKLIRE